MPRGGGRPRPVDDPNPFGATLAARVSLDQYTSHLE